MWRIIVLVLMVCISAPAQAKNKVVTIRGIVDWGTDTGSVGGGRFYPIGTYIRRSIIENIILTTCDYHQECELVALVDGQDALLSIYKIRKINTNEEPSSDVIVDAASWAAGIRDDISSKKVFLWDVNMLSFKSYRRNKETFYVLDFKLKVMENQTRKNLGNGKVRMVKRGDKWHYYR